MRTTSHAVHGVVAQCAASQAADDKGPGKTQQHEKPGVDQGAGQRGRVNARWRPGWTPAWQR
jgi:hypothetical protein